MHPAPALFPRTLERIEMWKSDPQVLGIVWIGSKSRGLGDPNSDDDLEVLLTDAAAARIAPTECSDALIEGEGDSRRMVYDAQMLARSALEAKALSPVDLDRWPYERAPVLFDRDGATALAVQRAGSIDPGFRSARLRHGVLDTWVAARRGIKTQRRGWPVAVRALTARGAHALARIVFALEHRWVPLDHWLEAELATLEDAAGAAPLLCQALLEGAPEPIMTALERLTPALEREGVPVTCEGIHDLFMTVIHPSHSAERRIHGLP